MPPRASLLRTYEEQAAGTQTEVYDSAAKDEHLKRMPTGQMEALVTDHRRGAILEHLHVRQGVQSLLERARRRHSIHL